MVDHPGFTLSSARRGGEEGVVYRLQGRVQVGEANVPFERVAVANSLSEARALVTRAVSLEMGVDEREVEIASDSRGPRLGELHREMGAFDQPSAAA
ncbi:MAG: hypothetical protein ACYCZN_01400 [Candidatus Dormibacteria bacterium]